MTDTLERTDSISEFEWAKPCETPAAKCDNEAFAAVWMAHHTVHPCGSTTFRCKQHLDFLIADCKRVMALMQDGAVWHCSGCGDTAFSPVTLEDYIRIIPL